LLLACTDGVGTPIRSQAADQSQDDDAGFDERGEDDYDAAHCAATEAWPPSYAADEAALLERINALRARELHCGERELDELEPLRLSRALTCSARLHSRDMFERDFVGRISPEGDEPDDRMRAAGFDVEAENEAIVAGEISADAALDDLLDDWDDCNALGTRRLTHIGVGRWQDRWTLDFARD
jgi:uncharacterized protein YkwD